MRNRISKSLQSDKMPCFHVFLLSTILVLFGFVVFESLVSVITSYMELFMANYWDSSVAQEWILFLDYSIFPIRDFFIAILFAYLYYYRGMKDREKDKVKQNRTSLSKLIQPQMSGEKEAGINEQYLTIGQTITR